MQVAKVGNLGTAKEEEKGARQRAEAAKAAEAKAKEKGDGHRLAVLKKRQMAVPSALVTTTGACAATTGTAGSCTAAESVFKAILCSTAVATEARHQQLQRRRVRGHD